MFCRVLQPAWPGCLTTASLPPGPAGGGSLLAQMRARLQGGRFRWLNEALYTSDGATALGMVQREPQLMEQYHEGEQGLGLRAAG